MGKDYDIQQIAKSATLLWDPLTEEQRQLLLSHLAVWKPANGEILFQEGDTPQHLYYLIRGKVTMHRNGISGPQIVRLVEPGAIFGYAASFNGTPYLSTAVAGTDTEVLMLPVSLMFHFIWENSNFSMLFLRELSALLGLSVERTINLTQKHIRGRLAESLIWIKEKYGVEDDGKTLAIYLSREDMGKMSNMTTSNAIRTLSAFASEGIVAIEGRKVKIIDEETLRHISQTG